MKTSVMGVMNVLGMAKRCRAKVLQASLELTGPSSPLIEQPLPVDDPERRQPDISLAASRLRGQPAVPLGDGLAKTIDWFCSVNLNDFRTPTPN